jgi:hypothetical protein
MSYVPDASQLRGWSYEKASLCGMPHIGCKYKREDIAATAWQGDHRRCAFCGRTTGSHDRHHEPPRSNGAFLMFTPRGRFVLLPALIDLCGSGTTGCHGDRHNGRLKIRWEWDTDEDARKWWDGTYLSAPFHKPHGAWLYEHGCYVFERNGREWRYRG